jgi:hypothetical protein
MLDQQRIGDVPGLAQDFARFEHAQRGIEHMDGDGAMGAAVIERLDEDVEQAIAPDPERVGGKLQGGRGRQPVARQAIEAASPDDRIDRGSNDHGRQMSFFHSIAPRQPPMP